ncbi:hypothetical protein R1flu_007105 [Riccia fluitans]|uniref:Uncharacterized protein n=1 Tax=Riccia fluitans TaxID=41844 RepID=A0ABD1YXW7_9MARC
MAAANGITPFRQIGDQERGNASWIRRAGGLRVQGSVAEERFSCIRVGPASSCTAITYPSKLGLHAQKVFHAGLIQRRELLTADETGRRSVLFPKKKLPPSADQRSGSRFRARLVREMPTRWPPILKSLDGQTPKQVERPRSISASPKFVARVRDNGRRRALTSDCLAEPI